MNDKSIVSSFIYNKISRINIQKKKILNKYLLYKYHDRFLIQHNIDREYFLTMFERLDDSC
jgi:hypothetical protein